MLVDFCVGEYQALYYLMLVSMLHQKQALKKLHSEEC
jgi:hypothetical protein